MIVLGLAKLGHQYVLYGVAAVICLALFVALILSPALSAHGRIWEKAAAGFLAFFVLSVLIVIGVVMGLVFVLYYPEIDNFVSGL